MYFIIHTHQSGFLPGRSTVTQLIEIYHKFCEAVNNGHEIIVVFLDISKAFDRVWHKGLLYKLKLAGINSSLLLWFQDYLSNRHQPVIINGQKSDWIYIKAGLGPGATPVFAIHQ